MALNIALCDDIMGLIGDHVETIRETAIAREKMNVVIGHLDDIHSMFSYHVEWSCPHLPSRVVRWAKRPVSRLYNRLLGDIVVKGDSSISTFLENSMGHYIHGHASFWDVVPSLLEKGYYPRDLNLSVAATEALCRRWAAGSPGDSGPSRALAQRLLREEEQHGTWRRSARKNSWNEWRRRNGSVFPIS
jgi:hypothetical protein